ncbi:MAG: hypothetical protein A2046_13670 [Bacteroidetes bacterium GWA2_30_7]|nr:MAG: hypothetical protein A2046_13670 [Bacteroidetes bacterium GWA2_30_7]
MPIDFFIAPCAKVDGNCKKAGVVCKTTTNIARFGISDKNSNKREPAFIDTENQNIWELDVENPKHKKLTFKAIDNCIDIFRDGGIEPIKKCEGFLFYENKILFVELKNRKCGRWLVDAREKFEETILKFKENYPNSEFELLEPIVANKLFSGTHQSEMVQKKILKDKIGLDFHIRNKITIN